MQKECLPHNKNVITDNKIFKSVFLKTDLTAASLILYILISYVSSDFSFSETINSKAKYFQQKQPITGNFQNHLFHAFNTSNSREF